MKQTQYSLNENEQKMFKQMAEQISVIQTQAQTQIQAVQDRANGAVVALVVSKDLAEGNYKLSEDFTNIEMVREEQE